MLARIVDLLPHHKRRIRQAAQLLVAGFEDHFPGYWTDLDAGLEEVMESFARDRISRVAVDERGNVLGWIGGIEQYDGHVWELHPLVVDPACTRGRALAGRWSTTLRSRFAGAAGSPSCSAAMTKMI
jgi:aminoglycoside 6'-N-acetyltransferase I